MDSIRSFEFNFKRISCRTDQLKVFLFPWRHFSCLAITRIFENIHNWINEQEWNLKIFWKVFVLFVNLLVDITGKPGFINLRVIFGNNVWLTLNSFSNSYTSLAAFLKLACSSLWPQKEISMAKCFQMSFPKMASYQFISSTKDLSYLKTN